MALNNSTKSNKYFLLLPSLLFGAVRTHTVPDFARSYVRFSNHNKAGSNTQHVTSPTTAILSTNSVTFPGVASEHIFRKTLDSPFKIIVTIDFKLSVLVKGEPKVPFSIATTAMYKKGCHSFPWIAPLYP